MPRILGIDTSLTGTGLCRIDVAADGSLGTVPVTPLRYDMLVTTLRTAKPKTKTLREYSRRVTTVVNQIDGAFEGVDLVSMEDLAFSVRGDGAFVLPWIWGRVLDLCEKYDVPVIIVAPSQIKKYATGKGNCGKDEVLARMIRSFPSVNITNDNEADATTAGLIGCRRLGFPVDHITQARAEVMAKIGEPKT